MVTTYTLSIWNDLRPFQVGFDHAFERFNTQLEHTQGSNFPPYNIKKLDDFNWTIEMALAGFNKKDIGVEYADNQLTIKSIFETKKGYTQKIYKRSKQNKTLINCGSTRLCKQ